MTSLAARPAINALINFAAIAWSLGGRSLKTVSERVCVGGREGAAPRTSCRVRIRNDRILSFPARNAKRRPRARNSHTCVRAAAFRSEGRAKRRKSHGRRGAADPACRVMPAHADRQPPPYPKGGAYGEV